MPRFCGKCGRPAGDVERFCAGCGSPLPEIPTTEEMPPVTAEPVVPQTEEQTPVTEGFAPPQGDTAPRQTDVVPQPEQPGFAPQQNEAPQPEAPVQPAPAAFNYFDQQPQNNNFGADPNPQSGFVPGAPNGSPAAAASAAVKKLNPVILIAAGCGLVAVIAAIIVISRLTRFEKIDAKDLIDVDFVGPNGYGECYAQLDVDPYFAESEYKIDYDDYSITKGGEDYSKIKYSPYFSEKKSKLSDVYKKAGNGGDAEDMRDALLDTNKKTGTFSITVKPSKNKGLKNGDKVTIEVKYDEDDLKEADIKLTNTKFEVEVKGLAEAEEVDPFSGFTPTFTGLDGDGECTYDTNGSYDFVSCYMSDGKSYYLNNGDELTFTAELNWYETNALDEEDASKGVWFTYDNKVYIWPFPSTETTKKFTVEGLTPLEEIDPTGDIVLEYESASPFLNVSAKLKDGSKLTDNVYVSVEDGYNHKYKKGDKVTVTVSAYGSLASSGYKLSGTPDSDGNYKYEIPVADDAPMYVDTSIVKEVEEGIKDKIKDQETSMKSELQNSSYFYGFSLDSKVKKVNSLELLDSYIAFTDINDYESLSWSSAVNYYFMLYKAECKLDKGSKSFYIVVTYNSLIKNSDGTFDYGSSVDIDAFEKKEDAVEIIKNLEGYTVTNVKDADSAPAAPATDDSSAAAPDTESAADTDSTADSAAADSAAETTDSAAEDSAAESTAASAADSSAADSKAS